MSGDLRKEMILAAAQVIFSKFGFNGARTREIAIEAKVNEATVFFHFKSKQELFQAAVLDPLEQLVGATLEEIRSLTLTDESTDKRRWEVSERVYEIFLSALIRDVPLLTAALFSSEAGDARTFYNQAILPILAKGIANLQKNLTEWKHRDFDARLLFNAAFGACFFIALDAHLRGSKVDVRNVAKQLSLLNRLGLEGR